MSVASPSIVPELDPVVSLGALTFDSVHVVEQESRLDDPLARAADALRTDEAPQAALAAVRAMYRGLGLDPTKTRPSSEALLRRIRKGQAFPRINALVDVCNWCSTEFQLPYGLYDCAHVEGPIVLRLGGPGEEYEGIRKDVVHVAGRPTLADDVGPFGNPTSDSARTMVTTRTSRALVVVYAPRAMDRVLLARRLDVTADRVLEYVGGVEVGRRLE